MDKRQLRNIIKEKKRMMTQAEIEENSKKITKLFLDSNYYKNSSVIYTYVSYNQEVITDDIIKRAWKDGKKVACPKVFKDNMAFCYVESFSDLAPGYDGILEPVTEKIALDKEVLMIMPGLAFDKEYNRIGYGKGFYDKYIDRNVDTSFTCVGLCFDFQLVDHIECEDHDKKVKAIVTPEAII